MTTKAITPLYIIITDLDGTLLDHDNYSFEAAKPSLQQLEQHNIPVIINSSKTTAEISTLRSSLNNTHPFISENGSAIFTPLRYDYKISAPNSTPPICHDDYATTILGEPREHILEVIKSLSTKKGFRFTQYSQCSTSDIMTLTGLTNTEAQQSSQRYYTEPIKWLDSDASKQSFIQDIEKEGLQVLQGGRFMHIMGLTDKGNASKKVKTLYEKNNASPVISIALGDSHNDIAMLQAADIAVVIRSPHHAPPEFEHPHKIISQAYGPSGWNECIDQIIFNAPIQ